MLVSKSLKTPILRSTLFLAGAIFAQACAIPETCLRYSPSEKSLSFKAAVGRRGLTASAWQSLLREKLRTELHLSAALSVPPRVKYRIGPSGPLAEPPDSGLKRTEVEIESVFDGRGIPAYLLRRDAADERAPVVILLHGHVGPADDVMGRDSPLKESALRLAQEGLTVLVPEIRSFGAFHPDGKRHKDYVKTKSDGEYLRETALDAESAVAFANHYFPARRSLSLVGHSLGGLIALHASALFPEIDNTVISGIFLPYACINTDYHDGCQHFKSIAKLAGIADIAGLIAPRRLLIHFGERDGYYTPAARSVYEQTRDIFKACGGGASIELALSKELGHSLDEKIIADFISGFKMISEGPSENKTDVR